MSLLKHRLAKTVKINRISAIWIIPIVTLCIGIWMLYSHFSQQGKSVTLLAHDASSIVAGKTVIKSRSVDIGIVESVTLSDDYKKVVIHGRINKEMEPLIKNDSIFWIVKPQIGRAGVTGLDTLLSGVYIELVTGKDEAGFNGKPFTLYDTPPLTAPNEAGIRINLESSQSRVVPRGASVLFRGYQVGNVESSHFDIKLRKMKYQLFIAKPFDSLVTQNVRFWKEGGVNLSLSSQGAKLDIPSLDVILSGGVSFDVPDGSKFGEQAKQFATYELYPNKKSIQDSQYTDYHEFLLFFNDSISGLDKGAPVEYRGIRIGTVSEVPFYTKQIFDTNPISNHNIPVLIRIEPGRLSNVIDKPVDLASIIIREQNNGLRAALKSANFITGSLYVDLNFYPKYQNEETNIQNQEYGYDTIKTVPTGLSQLQAKIIQTLDNLNNLPLDKTVNEFNQSLEKSQQLLDSLNRLINSKDIQNLPKELKTTIDSLNKTLQGIQPGSTLQNQLQADLQKFEEIMNQLSPVLETLNDKSNSLIFAAPKKDDPQPKARGH